MAEETRDIVIFGLESLFGHDAVDTVESAGLRVAASVRSRHDQEIAGTYPNLASAAEARRAADVCLVPLLTPGRRRLRVDEARALGFRFRAPVIHATAAVSPSARIGEGSLIGPLVAVSANVAAGAHLIVNRQASVGHDCRLGDYVSIGPGATLCGGCELADGVFVGAGAVLAPHVRVGRNAVIGAGAVATQHVEAGAVVVGNPARVVRTGVAGYRDVVV